MNEPKSSNSAIVLIPYIIVALTCALLLNNTLSPANILIGWLICSLALISAWQTKQQFSRLATQIENRDQAADTTTFASQQSVVNSHRTVTEQALPVITEQLCQSLILSNSEFDALSGTFIDIVNDLNAIHDDIQTYQNNGTAMVRIPDRFADISQLVTVKIDDLLTRLQFQDRHARILERVIKNLDDIGTTIKSGQPMDVETLIAQIKRTDTTADERHIHGTGPAKMAVCLDADDIACFY